MCTATARLSTTIVTPTSAIRLFKLSFFFFRTFPPGLPSDICLRILISLPFHVFCLSPCCTFFSGLLAFFASSFHFNPSAAFFQYRKQKTAARLVIKHHAAEHARHRIAAQNSVILPRTKAGTSQSWQRANTPHPPCLSKMSRAVPATGKILARHTSSSARFPYTHCRQAAIFPLSPSRSSATA